MNRLFLLLFSVAIVFAVPAEGRVWTSVSGATLDAELIEQRIDDVVLQKADGKEVAIKRSNRAERAPSA